MLNVLFVFDCLILFNYKLNVVLIGFLVVMLIFIVMILICNYFNVFNLLFILFVIILFFECGVVVVIGEL